MKTRHFLENKRKRGNDWQQRKSVKEKQVAVTTQHSLTYLVKGAARTHTEGEFFKGDSRRAEKVCKAHHGQHHQMWCTNQHGYATGGGKPRGLQLSRPQIKCRREKEAVRLQVIFMIVFVFYSIKLSKIRSTSFSQKKKKTDHFFFFQFLLENS